MPSMSCRLVQDVVEDVVEEHSGARITTHARLVSYLESELAGRDVGRSAIERWTVGLSRGSEGRLRSVGVAFVDGELVPCTSHPEMLSNRPTDVLVVYFTDQFTDAQCAIRAAKLQELQPEVDDWLAKMGYLKEAVSA